jgi:phospholipase C
MYVVSPFSRGGFVNSEVFDHTSVIRFCEKRFGVMEPNISAWRRAVCGDLTSCFDFAAPNAALAGLPETLTLAERAGALPKRTTPPTPDLPAAPVQASSVRRSRALPYRLDVVDMGGEQLALNMINHSDEAAVVLHAYDLTKPDQAPWRFTVGANNAIIKMWRAPYDIALFGPNGFYRRYTGSGVDPNAPAVRPMFMTRLDEQRSMDFGFDVTWKDAADEIVVTPGAYADKFGGRNMRPGPGNAHVLDHLWRLSETGGWYDFVLTRPARPGWKRRYAGRMENGLPSTSDPAMGGAAMMTWA